MIHDVTIGIAVLLMLLAGLPLAAELINQGAGQLATSVNEAVISMQAGVPIDGSTLAMNLDRLVFVCSTRP